MKKEDTFRQLLRKSGYKATTSRIAILEIFATAKEPLSAQRVIELLPRTADQATVYRTLKSLKEKNILKQIDLRHNHAHYELADIADHHHLICLSCGKIENVEHHNVESMERTILQNAKHFAEIQQHTLEFYGICKSCKKKRATADAV